MMVSTFFIYEISTLLIWHDVTEGFAGIRFPYEGIKFISSQHQSKDGHGEEKLINKSQKSALCNLFFPSQGEHGNPFKKQIYGVWDVAFCCLFFPLCNYVIV